jgi:Tol biopolymer transport system component
LIGKTLGHYEILGALGKGGMGEVYRARDTKLGREVAIKVLPREMSGDLERVARFDREARLLASLQHGHIASIYGFEHENEVQFLAMELVEGQTLEDRLHEGALSHDETLRIARQMAAGLEAAHEKGIIHRDLKPANVMLTRDGDVKILDFGLARAWFGESADEEDLSNSPTITAAMTQAGTILGTAAYMSPEQARGKNVDRRADIWAFGAILWEMVTGNRLFEGETISDTLAAVIRAEPEWELLPTEKQPRLCHLIERCLVRDPRQRLRDIGEVRIALSSPDGERPIEEQPAAEIAAGVRPGREPVAWTLAGISMVAALTLGWIALFTGAPESGPEIRASINPPEGHHFEGFAANSGSLTLSPDGKMLTFTASSGVGTPKLYLRSLDSEMAVPIPGSDGATFPFWSPDSAELAFFVGGKLKKQSISGGAPLTICDAPDGRGGTWNEDDVILFAPSTHAGLHRVSAGGGTAVLVTEPDPNRMGETTHRSPYFLPDGQRYLYFRGSHSAAAGDPVNSIWAGRLDSDETKEIMKASTNAQYAREHMFWVNDGFLMASPFDPEKLELLGDGFPVGEGVSEQLTYWRGSFAVSERGVIAMQHGFASRKYLTWFDRSGEELDRFDRLGRYDFIRLSPDNQRLAAEIKDETNGAGDIWVFDVARDVGNRLTFSHTNETNPIWSPDGARIAFLSNRDGPGNIYVRSADGTGDAGLLFGSDTNDEPWDWSPDGQHLIFNHSEKKVDLWVYSFESGEGGPFIATEHDEGWARLSPDGQWLGYISNASGRYELYLTRFPSGDGKWQISTKGADWLLGWNDENNEMYYLDLAGAVWAVKIDLENRVAVNTPRQLFSTRSGNTWASASDGARFIIGVPEVMTAGYSITLVVDWQGKR